MSLADLYNTQFGGETKTAEEDAEKVAEARANEILKDFSEEDCEKLAHARGLLDSFGVKAESVEEGIRQAGNLVDHMSEEVEETPEKTAAEQAAAATPAAKDEEAQKLAAEYDAAGRIMARGLHDELQKIKTEEGEVVDPASFAGRIEAVLKQ